MCHLVLYSRNIEILYQNKKIKIYDIIEIMGSLQQQTKPKESFGQKVKNIAEVVGTIKGMYDTGKMIYSGIQTAAPYIAAGMAAIA